MAGDETLIVIYKGQLDDQWKAEAMTIRALTPRFLVLENGMLEGVFERAED